MQKDHILPIKAFPTFISDAIEKSAFVNMRAGKCDATGMQSFAKSMKGFLTHYAGALADHSIAPPAIFSDLLRERAKALLNVAKVAAQEDDGEPVRLFGEHRCVMVGGARVCRVGGWVGSWMEYGLECKVPVSHAYLEIVTWGGGGGGNHDYHGFPCTSPFSRLLA